MADQILSVVMNYIWMGKVERPQRAVVYRPVNQGGLGMIHVGLFYRSLFLCPIYKNLTGPESPGCHFLSLPFHRPSFDATPSLLQSWRDHLTSRNPCITSRIFCHHLSWCRGDQWFIATTIAIGSRRWAVRGKLKSWGPIWIGRKSGWKLQSCQLTSEKLCSWSTSDYYLRRPDAIG